MKNFCLVLGVLVLAVSACGDDQETTDSSGPAGSSTAAATTSATASSTGSGMGGGTSSSAGGTGGATSSTGMGGAGGGQGGAAPFALTSTAYGEGMMIPEMYECVSGGGQGVSPPLAWTAGPAGTQSYAIVMRDIDNNGGFIHWVIWDIPAATMTLPEGVEQVYQPSTPAGAKQAPFNNQIIGYFGPCSPNSVNTYELTLYAIDAATIAGLDDNSTKMQAATAIVAAATATATLSGES